MKEYKIIKINNEGYSFIGNFSENQDGILAYFSNSNNKKEWISDFLSKDYLIQCIFIFWCINDPEDELNDSPLKNIINSNRAFFDSFFTTWSYDRSAIMDPLIFEDFSFGQFSNCNPDFEVIMENDSENLFVTKIGNSEFEIKVMLNTEENPIGSGDCYIKTIYFNKFISDMARIEVIIRNSID
jgi:hypothetical protein